MIFSSRFLVSSGRSLRSRADPNSGIAARLDSPSAHALIDVVAVVIFDAAVSAGDVTQAATDLGTWFDGADLT